MSNYRKHKLTGDHIKILRVVWYAQSLTYLQKLILSVVWTVQYDDEYCTETNRAIGEELAVSPSSISRNISKLSKAGILESEVIRAPSHEVIERRLKVNDDWFREQTVLAEKLDAEFMARVNGDDDA